MHTPSEEEVQAFKADLEAAFQRATSRPFAVNVFYRYEFDGLAVRIDMEEIDYHWLPCLHPASSACIPMEWYRESRSLLIKIMASWFDVAVARMEKRLSNPEA